MREPAKEMTFLAGQPCHGNDDQVGFDFHKMEGKLERPPRCLELVGAAFVLAVAGYYCGCLQILGWRNERERVCVKEEEGTKQRG